MECAAGNVDIDDHGARGKRGDGAVVGNIAAIEGEGSAVGTDDAVVDEAIGTGHGLNVELTVGYGGALIVPLLMRVMGGLEIRPMLPEPVMRLSLTKQAGIPLSGVAM